MRTFFIYLILIIISVFPTGCSFVVTKLSGLHKPSHVNNDQIDKAIGKLHIPVNNTFILDATFEHFYQRVSEYNETISHDHLQPLQVNVYDTNGKLVSFHINCYASGLTNLKWNEGNRFNSVPPKSGAPLDTTLNTARHLSMILNYKTHEPLSVNLEKCDYLFIVHWNIFWEKQSKRLVKLIENYKSTYSEYKIKVIYVNDDNLYN